MAEENISGDWSANQFRLIFRCTFVLVGSRGPDARGIVTCGQRAVRNRVCLVCFDSCLFSLLRVSAFRGFDSCDVDSSLLCSGHFMWKQ